MKKSPPATFSDRQPKRLHKEQRMETPTLVLGETEQSEQTPNKDDEVAQASKAKQHQVSEVQAKEEGSTNTKVHNTTQAGTQEHGKPTAESAAKGSIPDLVQNEKSLSPAEHLKALGKVAKPKGRPAKAKAKASPKSKSKAQKKTPPKAPLKRKTGKQPDDPQDQDNEDEEKVEDAKADAPEASSSSAAPASTPVKPKKRARKPKQEDNTAKTHPKKASPSKKQSSPKTGSKSKKGSKTKDTTADEKETDKASSAVKTKGRNTTKGSKAKESSTGNENNKPGKTKRSNEDLTEEQQEKKRLLSRKSSASHKARREALQNGLSVDQAKAAAAKATRLKSRLRYCRIL